MSDKRELKWTYDREIKEYRAETKFAISFTVYKTHHGFRLFRKFYSNRPVGIFKHLKSAKEVARLIAFG